LSNKTERLKMNISYGTSCGSIGISKQPDFNLRPYGLFGVGFVAHCHWFWCFQNNLIVLFDPCCDDSEIKISVVTLIYETFYFYPAPLRMTISSLLIFKH